MSATEIPRYRVRLRASADKRLGMRLDETVELGGYAPEDPAWLPTVGETFTFQGTSYRIALPAQIRDDQSGYAGDIYVEPA